MNIQDDIFDVRAALVDAAEGKPVPAAVVTQFDDVITYLGDIERRWERANSELVRIGEGVNALLNTGAYAKAHVERFGPPKLPGVTRKDSIAGA